MGQNACPTEVVACHVCGTGGADHRQILRCAAPEPLAVKKEIYLTNGEQGQIWSVLFWIQNR